jgi:hypothetical protein
MLLLLLKLHSIRRGSRALERRSKLFSTEGGALMRYFVYHRPDTTDVRPYILAEVVRESFDAGQYREWSAAASLAGERCEVLTREELLQRPDGARALLSWERRDDRQFDVDTRRVLETIESEEALANAAGRHLRLVPDAIAVPEVVVADPRMQVLATRRRRLGVESVRLQDEARKLIATVQARRRPRSSPDNPSAAEEAGGS